MAATSKAIRESAFERDASSFGSELEALWRLGSDAVRRRWRTVIGGALPRGLGRGMTLRILAYYTQVQQFGGLDRASLRTLAQCIVQEAGSNTNAASGEDRSACSHATPILRSPDLLRPGTLLSREHAGVLHNVRVLDQGFSWNEQTFDSLSKVALAITGTRWNGPRFFGLRDKPKAATKGKQVEQDDVRSVRGRGRATRRRPVPSLGSAL